MSDESKLEQVLKNAPVLSNISNGLSQAVGIGGGMGGFGFPANQGSPWSEQISQPTTVFKNLRWYLVSNDRQMLCEAYVELGLVQTIVDVPVDDGLRGGIEIKSSQLSPEQVEELQISIDRDNDLQTAGQAAKWNRLFGGAGILIITDQDPETPLEVEALGPEERLEFRAVDMWELTWDKQGAEGFNPATQESDFEFYSYYGVKVHKTRVMRLKGLTAPSFIRPKLRGWGFSVVETLVRSLNQYLKATDLAFEVLDEFKLDVYKIKNLVNTLLSPGGTQKIQERIQIANWQKNYQHAVVMDSEDDFDHKQLSFAGLADAMAGIRMQVASDMRMPLTKLFGISAAGFNSGEDDIEVYNSMVESQVRGKLKYDLLRICELKCQKLFGMVPDDLMIAFKPLRVLSAEQEETVKTQKYTRLLGAKQAGEITSEEFRDACNKGNLFDIQLDNSEEALADVEDEAAEDLADETEQQEPGANREDKQSSKPAPEPKEEKPAKEPKAAAAPKERVKQNADEWDESKHPRADDGKFGKGGGGEVHHSTYEKFSSKDIKPSKGGFFGAGYYVHRDKGATAQYGDTTHTYKLADKSVFDLSGDKLKPDAVRVFKEMGLDVEKITTPSEFRKPLQIAISEIRAKYPGEETVGSGAMEKLRSFLKEKGFIGIQFSHNDTDENMVIFDKKDLGLVDEGGSGKDGEGASVTELNPNKEKFKALKTTGDEYHSSGTRDEAMARAKAMRAEGVHASIWHIDGPRTGGKSVYAVSVGKGQDKKENSPTFDRASYEADGGDDQFDPRRKEFFDDVPVGGDAGLWSRAVGASVAAYGKFKWQFAAWFYKKHGGNA